MCLLDNVPKNNPDILPLNMGDIHFSFQREEMIRWGPQTTPFSRDDLIWRRCFGSDETPSDKLRGGGCFGDSYQAESDPDGDWVRSAGMRGARASVSSD